MTAAFDEPEAEDEDVDADGAAPIVQPASGGSSGDSDADGGVTDNATADGDVIDDDHTGSGAPDDTATDSGAEDEGAAHGGDAPDDADAGPDANTADGPGAGDAGTPDKTIDEPAACANGIADQAHDGAPVAEFPGALADDTDDDADDDNDGVLMYDDGDQPVDVFAWWPSTGLSIACVAACLLGMFLFLTNGMPSGDLFSIAGGSSASAATVIAFAASAVSGMVAMLPAAAGDVSSRRATGAPVIVVTSFACLMIGLMSDPSMLCDASVVLACWNVTYMLADSAEDGLLGPALAAVEPPELAHVRRGGKLVDVPASEIAPGDLVHVNAGERIPVDGRFETGAYVDDWPVPGTGAPVMRSPGAKAHAGALNMNDGCDVLAEATQDGSRLMAVRDAISGALSSRSPHDGMIMACLLVCVLTMTGAGIYEAAHGRVDTGMALLLLCSPLGAICSESLPYAAVMGRSASRGVIIRGPRQARDLSDIRNFYVTEDTGVARSMPAVESVDPAEGHTAAELLSYALCLMSSVGSRYTGALVSASSATDIDVLHAKRPTETDDGISAEVDGANVSATFDGDACDISIDDNGIGRISFGDRTADDARQMIDRLRRIGRVTLLSDDADAASGLNVDAVGAAPDPGVRSIVIGHDVPGAGNACRIVLGGDGLEDADVCVTTGNVDDVPWVVASARSASAAAIMGLLMAVASKALVIYALLSGAFGIPAAAMIDAAVTIVIIRNGRGSAR